MSDLAKEVTSVNIESELKQSYLDYAMSVIIGRALPDVRDGLKPVHRRVLYAMNELGNDWNKAYKKSARIVGDVIGKYHPHGDTAVYDTIVRMAQPFSLRYLLVDGQGNFGSVDGDAPAAMRYTEIRMTKMAHSLLADLEKDTVDFVPNYDGTEHIPAVLPTRVPNLLVNGSSGIAVGMATNIPPHNLKEVIDACVALIANPDLDISEIMKYIPGPDFPTAATINGRAGIASAYKTGRGRIYVRAKAEIEEDERGKASIIVHELPYQVNKARLLEKIGELVKEKKLEGIVGLRDESDKSGMRMVIEVRRGDNAEVVLNNLYKYTQLQTVFGINMVALSNNQPKLLNIKQMLVAFLAHRREVVTRRTLHDLAKARLRAHILEGLAVALANIDDIIALIKRSASPQEAKKAMLAQAWPPGTVMTLLKQVSADQTRPDFLAPEYGLHDDGYHLSPEQVQAILDLKLHRLTGLEKEKIHNEYNEIIDLIKSLLEILANPDRLSQVIVEELEAIKSQYADERRTEILDSHQDLTHEDLIEEESLVVTLSRAGYAKSQSLDAYQAQRRGGKGKSATKVKEEDVVKQLLVAHSHDHILCFSSLGKLYWLKTYQLPMASRQSRGRPMNNILPLAEGEEITSILPVSEFSDDHFVVMATSMGKIKKVALSQFSRPRASGIIAIDLQEEDHLVGAALTDGQNDIMMITDAGKAIRFNEGEVRAMGRTAQGVRGINLKADQKVVSLIIVQPEMTLLTVTENGFGQRTRLEDYRLISRGGQGVMAIQVTERNGPVISAALVDDETDFLLITNSGTMIRTRAAEVSIIGRNTQGVRLAKLAEDERVVSMEPVTELDEAAEAEASEETVS